MKTTLRRIGNSRGVLIPAPLLAACGITREIELRLEDGRLIIEPAREPRAGWFMAAPASAVASKDANNAEPDAWDGQPSSSDDSEWVW